MSIHWWTVTGVTILLAAIALERAALWVALAMSLTLEAIDAG